MMSPQTSLSPSQAFKKLLAHFGPQRWWPGDTPEEVMAGAILTQNTNWKNVEKAIANLKRSRLLSIRALAKTDPAHLADTIRPAGYYNIKAHRINAFFRWFLGKIGPSVKDAAHFPTTELRYRMLSEVSGIGPETADSILLYALNRPVFVVDAYTRRILTRHGHPDADEQEYDELKSLFEAALPQNAALFNEYHALLVAAGKLCRKNRPLCSACPLNSVRIVLGMTKRRRKCAR